MRSSSASENGRIKRGFRSLVVGFCAAMLGLFGTGTGVGFAQSAQSQISGPIAISGTVENAAHSPIGDALVRFERAGSAGGLETRTNAAGAFTLEIPDSSYIVRAEKAGLRSRAVAIAPSKEKPAKLLLVLDEKSPAESASVGAMGAMEFADKPNFTVAGVVDWTAVGGHGSDATLRASETLARETTTLKSPHTEAKAPGSSQADTHRQAGERAEKSGDPLTAVHEFEHAARLDPSEENYFAWGSELLLHRAVWQAQEVFSKGFAAYPKSARIQTGLGTALFAGAKYDEAALRLCEAADLNPADAAPYLFLGKIGIAAPTPLPCVEQKLARFAQAQPGNALANYFYAMAILRRQEQSPDPRARQQAEAYLAKAVAADVKCGDAYLQLGVLSQAERDLPRAIGLYTKAIEANPELGEAHYRLAVAYDRQGQSEKAKQEFQIHTEIEKRQADAVEQQRREVKQFQVVLQGQPATSQTN